MARFPPDTLRGHNSGESPTARATWPHVYVGSLADFDGDWLGSSVADVAAIVHAGWMLDHLIDNSIEGVLPSTAISMQSVDDRFRVHELHSHREPWARALAAPPEVQEQAIAMVKAKAARHWSDALQSYSDLSTHAYGAAYRYARELIGGTEHLREWKESRRILAQWLMYANNLVKTTGCDVPEIPAKALTSTQVGKRAGPDERYAKTTMRDDQRQAAIELAQVGYQAYKIQIEQGVPGATASEMAWAAHGPLRTKVAPVPPPRSYPPDPTSLGVTVYFYDKNGSDVVKLGVWRDSFDVMVGIAAHVWAPESDPATVVGDYDVVGSRGGMALTPVHVHDDLTMTYGDDPTPIDGMTIRDWLRVAGLPIPAQYVKKTVPRSKSKATKSKKWKVLASEQTLLIRTDFTDDALWAEIRDMAVSERMFVNGGDQTVQADLLPVDDPAFAGMTTSRLRHLPWPDPETEEGPVHFYVVDKQTMKHPEHPILAVSLPGYDGETFRLTPEAMALTEANLSIANLGFEDFTADADGINREA